MKNFTMAAAHWIVFAVIGTLLGLLTGVFTGPLPEITPIWLTLPFFLLLLAIAVAPLVAKAWWHHRYPHVAIFLAGFVAAILATGSPEGISSLIHTGHEYVAFIALIGGLYFVASCIKLEISGKTTPIFNTAYVGCGAILANLLGTTGASLLLLRPFIELNRKTITPLDIVFFIIIVSNCGGALTPIGDPPLYLGYLKGVPFFWTLEHLLLVWLCTLLPLLATYFATLIWRAKNRNQSTSQELLTNELPFSISLSGWRGIACLGLMIAAIFVDPLLALKSQFSGNYFSAPLQIVIAACCFFKTPSAIKQFNQFSIEPFKEVALLFVGIFVTMIPALQYLAAHGSSLGLVSAEKFFYATGGLSAILDNAPTYLNFLQLAVGPDEVTSSSIGRLIATPLGSHELMAISCGSVFFGALTYIGNGPNFMVRSMCEGLQIKTPSFFGYFLTAILVLLPILLIIGALFFHSAL